MHLSPIPFPLPTDDSLFATDDGVRVLTMCRDFYATAGHQPPWVGYAIVEEGKLLGTAAFVSAPVEGRVEISYWTFAEFEGRGIASFACAALIEIARKADPRIIVTAKTAPEHNASTRILQKQHFVYAGVVQDHEIGDAWAWELAAEIGYKTKRRC